MQAPVASEPQGDDAPLDALGQAGGAVIGAGGPVGKGRARPIPVHPPLDRCRRASEPFGGPAHRPPLINHQGRQAAPSLRRQRCISVCHEGLLVQVASVVTHILPRRPSPIHAVHNLPRKYS